MKNVLTIELSLDGVAWTARACANEDGILTNEQFHAPSAHGALHALAGGLEALGDRAAALKAIERAADTLLREGHRLADDHAEANDRTAEREVVQLYTGTDKLRAALLKAADR